MAQDWLNETLVQMGVLFFSGALTAFAFHKLKLPTVLGFILVGVLLGPSALNWIHHENISVLSELGIIFLLFLVGLELSVTKIKRLKFQAPLSGMLQLTLSGLVLTLLFAFVAGIPLQLAFLLGSILALSSTAIVLKRLEEKRQMETLHGRVILAILIIQDMAIVPLMTLVTSLSTPFQNGGGWQVVLIPTLIGISKALLVAIITMGVSLKLLPKILDRLAGTNQKEIFLLTSIAIVLGAAWVTNALGISYEAGALIAGISLSGTLFSHQVFADNRAYRDVFMMLFFVSMGLWVDLGYIIAHWPMVLGLTLLISMLKALATYGAIRISGFHHKNALWGGLALFQVGEFAFIALTHLMKNVQAIPAWAPIMKQWMPLLSNTIVLTMFLTPLAIECSTWLIKTLADDIELPEETHIAPEAIAQANVVIAGFGPVAQQLIRSLQSLGLSYCIVEMNSRTVKALQKNGEPCLYGDVSHIDILKAAGIEQAEFLVLTFPDIRAAESATQQAKTLNPSIKTLVRARYQMDLPRLETVGATQIVCEEFETSLDFVAALMRSRQSHERDVDLMLETLRLDMPKEIANLPDERRAMAFGRGSLKNSMKIEWLTIQEESPLVGKTIAQSRIRQESGVTILSVLSALDQRQQDPWPDYCFTAGDTLVVIGTWEQLKSMEDLVAPDLILPDPPKGGKAQ